METLAWNDLETFTLWKEWFPCAGTPFVFELTERIEILPDKT